MSPETFRAPNSLEGRASPFDLSDPDTYARWRDAKLAQAPTKVEDLLVEIADPRRVSAPEHAAILERCKRANMALYTSRTAGEADKSIPSLLGERFGLRRLDHNPGADEDAISSLSVQTDALHAGYIPYTDRPIAWHTDGYYNPPERQIHGLLLHCVSPAAKGGANALLDAEILYILIRDRDPGHIEALMHPRCMTIPANPADGSSPREARPDITGPVFSVQPDGHLHLRYTDRTRSIRWRDDPRTANAVDFLKTTLHQPSPWRLEARLEAGWGLICNNVLHTRTGFTDGPVPRLLYRARYYDRIAGT
jgi:hypothetical protein